MSAGALPPVELSVSDTPEVGVPVQLELTRQGRPAAGLPVVEVRPAQGIDAAQRTAGTSDSAGRLTWTPDSAGLTALEVGETSHALWVAPGPVQRLEGAVGIGAALLVLVGGQLWLRRRERA